MLHSTAESTITVALSALIVHERSDPSSVEQITEAGAIDALLDLLQSHQLSVRPTDKIRIYKTPCNFSSLSMNDMLEPVHSVSGCRALVSLLEDQPTEDMKMVAICALQNFVMRSRTNRRAVAEAGGILVIQELLLSPNAEVASQTTLGRVTIQIDEVVTEGVYSGLFSLNPDSTKDGSSRTLEIEIIWSYRIGTTKAYNGLQVHFFTSNHNGIRRGNLHEKYNRSLGVLAFKHIMYILKVQFL
ncbi:hypothetical protein F3Y22_tig00112495pilonHSYRG00076 [Hibiscus syriacus]|uniref:Uncharacterized protein n=1 Tax=Hibiscus syriacus TaxID=106335 RepID=A0A6A2Y979_HIBSY|nr:hypothetical protein F3Y22_tig00112495pilonHSYRG00076 [Hibiscus syriacus]